MRILVMTKRPHDVGGIVSVLAQRGHSADVVQDDREALAMIGAKAPDVVMLDAKQHSPQELRYLIRAIRSSGHPRLLGLMDEETLTYHDLMPGLDDFVIEPYKPAELTVRLGGLCKHRDEATVSDLIKRGDLVIDPAKFEVRLAGRVVPLTLKEYELLRFLATNEGKVFSREALLDEIWGHDHFCGPRTVDVYITRIRSKITSKSHSFIETVRDVGYKFKLKEEAALASPMTGLSWSSRLS